MDRALSSSGVSPMIKHAAVRHDASLLCRREETFCPVCKRLGVAISYLFISSPPISSGRLIENMAAETIDFTVEGRLALKDVSFALLTGEISTSLPCTKGEVYMNLTTKENKRFCVSLNMSGFKVNGSSPRRNVISSI